MMLPAIFSIQSASANAEANPYAIIPQPAILIQQRGHFRLTRSTVVDAPKSAQGTVNLFLKALPMDESLAMAKANSNVIRVRLEPQSKLGEEGYRLEINESEIYIGSKTTKGIFYGFQSLRQLMPTSAFNSKISQTEFKIPAAIIEDQPRFGWRGAHLDVGRHFMPKEFIKKYIDLLAMHKLNVFHWHLTEDQGWRLEIKKYPKLTSVGSMRSQTMLKYSPAEYENKPYGGFYTQEDAKEIVRYAAERNITVVPEIEMPGHAQAAIAAYPELGNTGRQLEVGTKWGVIPHVFNPEEKTIRFLKDVLDEVMAIFPSKYIHVGGDECPKDEWKASPRVQQLIKERGLKDEHEMQSWFIRQMDQYLASKGRNLIGWDEILEGGLAPGAAVMSWRGEDGGIEAAKAKHKVVMASNNALYFDYYQADPKNEPYAIGGYLPLRKVYEFDIVPKNLTPEQAPYILGGQFQLWTEYLRTPEKVEYMAFPRGCAAAEIFWSPKSKRNFRNFGSRLTTHMQRFQAMGVNARPLDQGFDEPTAFWKAGQMSNDYQSLRWDISSAVPVSGSYTVQFLYTSGGHRLDIDGIEILVNGESVATDPHYGRTGLSHVDNIWKVNIRKVTPGVKVTLVAKVRGDGGGDSNGEITVSRS